MNPAPRHWCKQGLLTVAQSHVAQNSPQDREQENLDLHFKKENFCETVPAPESPPESGACGVTLLLVEGSGLASVCLSPLKVSTPTPNQNLELKNGSRDGGREKKKGKEKEGKGPAYNHGRKIVITLESQTLLKLDET